MLTVSPQYIQPFKSDGTREDPDGVETTFATARGVYTLAAGTTYYFVLPVLSCGMFDAHLTHDNAIIITSATIETSSHAPRDVSDVSTVPGEWMDQDPSTAFVATVGANTTATNGVGAATGGAAGGMDWQAQDFAAARARIKVVVGATGGEVRMSFCGKV